MLGSRLHLAGDGSDENLRLEDELLPEEPAMSLGVALGSFRCGSLSCVALQTARFLLIENSDCEFEFKMYLQVSEVSARNTSLNLSVLP